MKKLLLTISILGSLITCKKEGNIVTENKEIKTDSGFEILPEPEDSSHIRKPTDCFPTQAKIDSLSNTKKANKNEKKMKLKQSDLKIDGGIFNTKID